MNTLKERYTEECQAIIKKAETLYNMDLGDVTVHYDIKGMCAGRAKTRGLRTNRPVHSLHFNIEAVTKEWDEMFNDTIPHEVAHLVCHQNPRCGKGHDSGWRAVCIALGGNGATTHKFELSPGRITKKHLYTTDQGETVELSTIRHNKLQRRQVEYYFSPVKGKITRDGYQMQYKTPKVVAKPTNTPKKNGKVTNSSIIRDMIEAYKGNLDNITSDEEFLQTVLARCGQTRQLARSYIKNITNKIQQG